MKIKLDSIKYKVDKKNGVIICTGKWNLQNIYDFFPENLSWIAYDYIRTYFNALKYDCITIKAIAKCSPEDEFNEITGKRIAESRMQIKMYNTITNALNSFKKTLLSYVKTTTNNLMSVNYKLTKELNHLNKLIEDGNKLLPQK